MSEESGLRVSRVLAGGILGLFLLAAVTTTIVTDRSMRARARKEAAAKARLLTDQNLAIHSYFSHTLKPAVFSSLDLAGVSEHFDPAWMSSTYAVRGIHEHLDQLSPERYYYKECAINARSPRNEADPFEASFLRELNTNPGLVSRTVERTLDGETVLAVLRRGEALDQSCMRCHDTPEMAPADLVARYGPDRSFGRTAGDVASAISVRIPLAEAYAEVNQQTLRLSLQFGLILLALWAGHFWLTRRLLLVPLNHVRDKALAISHDPAHLGEQIRMPWGLEFRDLAQAFNHMSAALRQSHDSLENKVRTRTQSLQKANARLEEEIAQHRRAERQVERFSQIMDSSLNEIYLFDAQSLRFLEVNKGARANLGYGIDELRAMTPIDLKPDMTEEAYAAALQPLRDGSEQTVQIRTTHQRKDGTAYPVEAQLQLMEGDPPVFASIMVDVSQREQQERSLRDSERRHRNLFMEMLNGFALHEIICDAQGKPVDYRFLDVNPAFEQLTGLSADAVLGKTVLEILPATEPEWIALYGEVALTGEPARFEKYTESLGKYFEVAAYQTDPGRFACIFVDVTARKKNEADLRDREEHFRSLFEQAGDFGLILTPNTHGAPTIVDANDAAPVRHGYTREELIGQPVTLLIDTDEQARALELLARATDAKPLLLETLHRCKDGTTFPVEASVKLVHAAGSAPVILSIERDVSERRSLEHQLRQAQRMEAVGQLAGGIAHDFNNLLYVIQGYSEMAMEGLSADAPLAQQLNHILRATDRAATLVRQMLAFSRRQVLHMADVDMNHLVQDLGKMLQRVIGEHITLRILPGRNLGTVRADTSQIEQVMMNLCLNARDAMTTGGTLTIETENVFVDEEYCASHAWCKPGHFVLVSVTDTGHGMDAQTLESVFEPFFTTKGVGEGTGLGLSMVYGLVKQHGGMVNVYSEVGSGSTFKVYLPSVERMALDVGHKIATPIPVGTETLLVAEDDEGVRRLSRVILEKAGYRVLEAVDGEDALRVFEAHRDAIDLAILDVMMPRMGGKAAYERIRAERPDLKVLFASGYSMNAIHTNFVLDAGLELIQKPYNREALLRKVRELLDA